MEKIYSYKGLDVWKKSLAVVKDIYRITNSFPRSEIFGLTNQIRRAAVSIPSNIAEGHSRNSRNEFKQFLFISLGSAAELETQLIISHEVGFLTKDDLSLLTCKIDEVGKMIRGIIKKLVPSA